jgi:hypothetical protein
MPSVQAPRRFAIRRLVALGVFVAAAVSPGTAAAQKPDGQKPDPQKLAKPTPRSSLPDGSKWDISFHGSMVLFSNASTGDSHTPAPGPTFILADGATASRYVSSWYFGDGAALLNQVLTQRGLTARVLAMDRPPGWPVTGYSRGEVGGRIARHLKGPIWFEAGVDIGLDGVGFDADAQDRIEATRASFETAFAALATSAASVITSSTVTSTATLDSGGRRLLVSGVVQYRGNERPLRPVFFGGVGVSSSIGPPATLTLTGTYRFTTPAQAVIEETDTMRLSYETSNSIVWIFGGGFMHDLSRSSAYRVEVRLRGGATKFSANLEAEPSRVTASPGGVVVLNATNPGLQFSSSPSITPNLSSARPGFSAFDGEGPPFQLVVSAYYVRRV